MKKYLLVAVALLSFTASADQLFIRNRPFKGNVTGVGKNLNLIRIELPGLVEAAGCKLTEVSGNWVVHREEETAALPESAAEGVTGRLFVNGKEVAVSEDNGVKFVSLQEFTNAMGGKLSHNPSMQSVDLNFPMNPVVAETAKPARKNQPETASFGKYTLVNFGAPW